MNWNNLKLECFNIVDKNKNNLLNNYELITRSDLDKLELGMHIKYVIYKEDEKSPKIYNGGFLINILNKDNIVNMILVLKSNIIWKLRFMKYKIYGKNIKKFNRTVNIIDDLKLVYKDIILNYILNLFLYINLNE